MGNIVSDNKRQVDWEYRDGRYQPSIRTKWPSKPKPAKPKPAKPKPTKTKPAPAEPVKGKPVKKR